MRRQSQAPYHGADRHPGAAPQWAMPAPLSPLTVAIPAAIRSIFLQWGEPYDPALLIAGRGAIGPLSAFYRRLGAASGPLRINMRELFQIDRDAGLNAQFGLVAELRRDGRAVGAWVDAAARAFFPSGHLFNGPLVNASTDELERVLIDACNGPDLPLPRERR